MAIFVLAGLIVVVASGSSAISRFLAAHRVAGVALLAAVALPVLHAFFRGATPLAFPFDDSYLSLAAARNVAERFEVSVVRGRPLEGVTSALHVILVGLPGAVIGVESAARLVSLLAFLAAAVGAGCHARALSGDDRALPLGAGLCLLSGPMLFDVGNGMETSLFTALLIWMFHAQRTAGFGRRGIAARGVLAGLVMLARPEGVIAAGCALGLPVMGALRRRDVRLLRAALLCALVAAAILAPLLLANLALTGHAMPATVSAKSVFFSGGKLFVPDLHTLRDRLGMFLGAAGWVAVAALAGLAITKGAAQLAFVAAFYAAYLMLFPDALGHYHTRYQHPLWTLVGAGAAALACRAARRADGMRVVRRVLPFAFAFLLLAPCVRTASVYASSFRTDVRMTIAQLAPMVREVRRRTGPGDLVAAHDVGALAYFGGRRVLDIVGLTDGRVARRLASRPRERFAAARGIVREERPALLVLLRDWETAFLGFTREMTGGELVLVWSSVPNAATGAVYDVYECRW